MKTKLIQWLYNGSSAVLLIFYIGLQIADNNSYSNQDDTLIITYSLMLLFMIATIIKLDSIIRDGKLN